MNCVIWQIFFPHGMILRWFNLQFLHISLYYPHFSPIIQSAVYSDFVVFLTGL